MEQKYKVIAIYGEGGSGKDTILKEILKFKEFNFNKIIGTTTRPPREGEKDGVEYYFISPEAFAIELVTGELVEAAAFRGWYYGTSLSAFAADKVNIGIFNDKALDILLQDSRFDIVPIYISVTKKNRLIRMLSREEEPDINEVIRRYQADEKDFADFFAEHDNLPDIAYINDAPLDLDFLKQMIQGINDQFDFWANSSK